MTDQRTMRTFLDLVAERDEALGAATDLAEQAELTMLELRYAEFVHDVLRDCLQAADAERDEALGEATRLADLLADCETLATMAAGVTLGIARKCGLQVEFRDDAARTPESGPLAAERPDPFHGHHPEHQSAQGTP